MNNNSPVVRKESVNGGAKTSYKFWVLFAALLLALWSMFTGSVTLKWSVIGNLSRFSDDLKSPNYDDLDILVRTLFSFSFSFVGILNFVILSFDVVFFFFYWHQRKWRRERKW